MSLDLSQCSDRELAAFARAGQQQVYRELLRRYKTPVFRLIQSNIGDPDEAMDLTQETFVAGFGAIGRYDADRPFRLWIARIALNKCRDWGRRRAVRRFFYGATSLDGSTEAADAAASVVVDDSNEAALTNLDRAIATLPTQLKEPLLLTAFEGLSQIAAGEALGISAKAVETRVYRARKLLAEALRANGVDVGEP